MKRVVKLSMIAMAVSMVVGCASSSDIDNLQSQIDSLKTSVTQASSDASSALSAANNAATSAASAEAAANRAAQAAQDTSFKLDQLHRKNMVK